MNEPGPIISPQPAAPVTMRAGAAKPVRRKLSSHTLLNGQPEVLIDHDGEIYSLRHTRNGKLILTK